MLHDPDRFRFPYISPYMNRKGCDWISICNLQSATISVNYKPDQLLPIRFAAFSVIIQGPLLLASVTSREQGGEADSQDYLDEEMLTGPETLCNNSCFYPQAIPTTYTVSDLSSSGSVQSNHEFQPYQYRTCKTYSARLRGAENTIQAVRRVRVWPCGISGDSQDLAAGTEKPESTTLSCTQDARQAHGCRGYSVAPNLRCTVVVASCNYILVNGLFQLFYTLY
jgi:hypothetical protein